ncbi:MAG TPA: Crp/Fnr family transcriptional regulator [Gemmatimonadaceae bacterium]|nr:Crp/Fnr family transcriptional regulator [Gemmatimonadaceae bacterium]
MIEADHLDVVPLFAALAPRARRELAARGVERRYRTGQTLFAAGSTARALHVVVSGRVRVMRGRGDRRQVIHVEGPGGTLGEVPLFTSGGYPATAEAAEPTTCLLFSRDAIEAAIAADPTLASRLLQRLAERVRALVNRVETLALQGVTARLASLILARAAVAHGPTLTLGMTQREAAEELGTVREVLVRALRTLRTEGMIVPAGRGRLRIVDARALARLAGVESSDSH